MVELLCNYYYYYNVDCTTVAEPKLQAELPATGAAEVVIFIGTHLAHVSADQTEIDLCS